MAKETCSEWFEDWFNTPYYHQLYRHRDEYEAAHFVEKLVAFLHPAPGHKALDLACGRGRHSHKLHELGLEVTGMDLSPQNIAFAERYAKPGLRYKVQDMRTPFGKSEYHYIFNLFTSFGYFEKREDNYQTAYNMAQALKPGGKLIIDFMNVHRIAQGLREKEVKKVGDIDFLIERKLQNGRVVKKITFEAEGQKHCYEEQVQLLELADFEDILSKAHLEVRHILGNFNLTPFQAHTAERLILIAQK